MRFMDKCFLVEKACMYEFIVASNVDVMLVKVFMKEEICKCT